MEAAGAPGRAGGHCPGRAAAGDREAVPRGLGKRKYQLGRGLCLVLRDTLLGAGCFQQEERQAIAQVLEKIEACGRYAQAWYEGGVPEESWEPEKMAWLEEGAYSFLRDMAARFSLAQPEPIPFQPERELYR